ncbi:glycine tRNA synthetase subunit beta [Haemophilus influenzae]|uniref:Glycine tRNA synthetase subunit beta n=1 Tax=Haemophilus influenzae TaxID=727 RepID=A0A2X1PMS3_HAEIF|nr:glycine tRNA synthetase subunit beta [Haemophilus influenzae]
MRWRNCQFQNQCVGQIKPCNLSVQFHTVTMLLGDELIEGEILGVASARTIRGHRFLGEKEF